MQSASSAVVALPVRADSRLLVASLVRRAGSTDPIAIAEALGLSVYWAEPWEVMGAPGAVVGRRLMVSTATNTRDVEWVVARLLGLAVVDMWHVDTKRREAFALSLGARLIAAHTAPVAA